MMKLQQLSLTANDDSRCHVIWRKTKEASFQVKEEDKLLQCKIPNQATCIHFTSLHYFVSCLSQSVNYRSVQALSQKYS